MRTFIKKIPWPILTLFLLWGTISGNVCASAAPEHSGYKLEQVLIFSRHNIRSPLAEKGSILDQMTPHTWGEWSSPVGELTPRGAAQELTMGQYFSRYLVEQGFMEENWEPKEGEVRFYANSLQRTIATAQSFSLGMLPLANRDIEYHMEIGTMDPLYKPALTHVDDALLESINGELDDLSANGLQGYIADLKANVATLEGVLDFAYSDYAKENHMTSIPLDDVELTYEEGKQPSLSGGLRLAVSVVDALIMQYYEQADDSKVAFGHTVTEEEWKDLSEILSAYQYILFGLPSEAANIANPLLTEIRQELSTSERRFTFLCGHDSNMESIMKAMKMETAPLEGTIYTSNPIGGKLVFEKWADQDEKEYMTVSLVYQTSEQMRKDLLLEGEEEPVWMPITLEGLTKDTNGMYPFDDVMERLESLTY